MRLAVLRESAPGENRVALVPDSVVRLVRAGHEVRIESAAGQAAGFPDASYQAAGAAVLDARSALEGAAVVAMVQRPSADQAELLPPGSTLVGLLAPHQDRALLDRLAARGVDALAMERVPRTTRAQSMDALSSQATVAGYKAVLLGAAALPRILPMLTTAAGTLAPAKVFVIGAGVAGLQAIATARRLGAVVSAFDVRPAVKEQVQTLGATFVEVPGRRRRGRGRLRQGAGRGRAGAGAGGGGGAPPGQDLVITTAQIPGKPAPRLITAEMVRAMRPGSVIVDLAAESGGNCELTRAGETVREARRDHHRARVNLPATVPFHASQMYGRNVLTLVTHALEGRRSSTSPTTRSPRRHAGRDATTDKVLPSSACQRHA